MILELDSRKISKNFLKHRKKGLKDMRSSKK
jgi:hypothetical protein